MARSPIYQELVNRYRRARASWKESLHIRQAARTLGMEEREYCDWFLQHNYGPLTWTSSSIGAAALMKPDFDDAFDEALEQRDEVRDVTERPVSYSGGER